MSLEFALRGELQRLCLAESGPQVREDELWKTTCFEAFVRPAHGPAYFEFNMSPSSAWASYRFDDYRSGMAEATIQPDQEMYFMSDGSIWQQDVTFGFAGSTDLNPTVPLAIALAAVIEEEGGHKSYWALAHPDGPPDFHNRDCFIAHLPPVTAP